MMLAVFIVCATEARARVAHGLVDPNIAADRDMLALPNMTPAIVKELMAARPFMSVTELNTFLLGQKPTAPQAAEFYGKAFVHLNLNTGTREEILLIPGAGTRMAREFAEYRPWKTKEQFDKEIGKYVGPKETARLWRYVVIQ
jgi:hypothetical protein